MNDGEKIVQLVTNKFGNNFVLHDVTFANHDEMLGFLHSLSFTTGTGKNVKFITKNLHNFILAYPSGVFILYIGGKPNKDENYEIIRKLLDMGKKVHSANTSSEDSTLTKDLLSAWEEINSEKKTKNPQKSKNCFIATAVYGDLNAPQVIELRKYRDNYLLNQLWGKLFVYAYYRVSPPIANWLKDKKPINNITRKILDAIVIRIIEKHQKE